MDLFGKISRDLRKAWNVSFVTKTDVTNLFTYILISNRLYLCKLNYNLLYNVVFLYAANKINIYLHHNVFQSDIDSLCSYMDLNQTNTTEKVLYIVYGEYFDIFD